MKPTPTTVLDQAHADLPDRAADALSAHRAPYVEAVKATLGAGDGSNTPWVGATPEQEMAWYGTSVLVIPKPGAGVGTERWLGTLVRVLNRGDVLEVTRPGTPWGRLSAPTPSDTIRLSVRDYDVLRASDLVDDFAPAPVSTDLSSGYEKGAAPQGDFNVPGKHILDRAKVTGDAEVRGDATVGGYASVSGNAQVSDDAKVYGNALVYGNASVSGNALVSYDASVSGNAKVTGRAKVSGFATVSDDAKVTGKAEVTGDARIGGTAVILGGKWDGSEGKITEGTWKSPTERVR